MQFDNIEYFAQTQQNTYVTECTHTLAYVVMKRVKQCTCTIRVCSFTAWFSRLKCIKSDHKIQDMGAENVYIYVLHRWEVSRRKLLLLTDIQRTKWRRFNILCMLSVHPKIPRFFKTVWALCLQAWMIEHLSMLYHHCTQGKRKNVIGAKAN